MIAENAKKIATENLRLKFLALLLAICIWSFISLSREVRYDLLLPVELINVPTGFSAAGDIPREIRFTLYGPSILIEAARHTNSTARISLRGAIPPGKTVLSSMEAALKLPEGVKILNSSPKTMLVELTRTDAKQNEGDDKK